VRTLVTERQYFGMDALTLRAATGRVLARVAGLPPERACVSSRTLYQDFALDPAAGKALVSGMLAEGLLAPDPGRADDYQLTERFVEFATARVVEPLARSRARELLSRARTLAAQINAEWTRNPLQIEMLAPYGSYMSRDTRLAELELGVVVRLRAPEQRARWGRMATNADGARELRSAFRALSSFIRVHLVSDAGALPRPFSVVFQEA
jgi:hypothetical protein